MRRPTPSALRTFLLAAGHLVLLALCLELAARLDDRITWGAPLLDRYDAEVLRDVDADGIRHNVPGARFQKWRIDSLGFRGDGVSHEKPPGHVRVVCLGQSESFGLYEGEGGEWPARLGRFLRARHPEVEVLNASVVGRGVETRRAYLERYVFPVQPDVVVLVPNPYELELTPPAPPGAAVRTEPSPAPGPAWTELSSRLLPKLSLRFSSIAPALARAVRTWRLDRTLAAADRRAHPLEALPAGARARYGDRIRELVAAARAHGATAVLVTYPTLVDEANRTEFHLEISQKRVWMPEFSESALIGIVRSLNGDLRGLAAELGVPLVDAAAAVPRTPAFFADDVHYTDQGAERVAESVRDVLERGLSPHPASTVRGAAPVAAER